MPKIYPDAHILESMQSQPLSWWKRLAELIDNALDARATRVSISFKGKVLSVSDDGIGIKNPLSVVTLGRHDRHSGQGLGRYGIGAKDAWLSTGPVIEIDSVHCGVRRHLRVDVRELAKSDWDVADPSETLCDILPGTDVRITLKAGTAAPSWQSLTERLGWTFAPALLKGRQIVFRDTKTPTPLAPVIQPPLLNAVSSSFDIDGKHVDINIGTLPPGVKMKFNPFWIQYRHRVIKDSFIGLNGRCIGKVAGTITLGEGWRLAKNKDELIDDSNALADAIYERIKHILDECEATTEQLVTDAIKTELEGLLNAALLSAKREKRDAGESTGTRFPADTGKRRTKSAQTTDNPGSVLESERAKRRGFSMAFVEEEETHFGRFDALGKLVVLNLCHPVIAAARRIDDRHGMLSAACVVLANHDATTDGGQKLLGCSVGDFQGAYVKLITSLMAAEEPKNAE